MIGNGQIAMITAQAAFGVLGPMILFIVLRKKYRMKTEAFVIGCITMLVFAMVLESAVHRLVLGSSAGSVLNSNTLYYAIYGAAMAALFEETGRYIAFHVLMKHLHSDDRNAIMYGAGHGGLEVFMVLGMTGVSNLAMVMAINNGTLPQYTGEAQELLERSVEVLKNTAAPVYLFGMMERVSAVMLQIVLSIIVWQTVKQVKGRIMYLFLAMLLHFAFDFLTVMLGSMIPVAVLELILLVIAAAMLTVSLKRFHRKQGI